jgi:2'-5' RNA ligase
VSGATGGAGAFKTGETGLIVKVSEAERAVREWRSRFDPGAAAGVPAHITVLYPFLPQHRVDAAALAELAALFGTHRAFEIQLAQSRRFPGVLYLAPEPDAGLRALTGAIAARWPEAPPYGGQFADAVPHLTVAQSQDSQVLDAIEADIRGRLPIAVQIAAVQLIAYDGERWIQVRSFGLATCIEERKLPGLPTVPELSVPLDIMFDRSSGQQVLNAWRLSTTSELSIARGESRDGRQRVARGAEQLCLPVPACPSAGRRQARVLAGHDRGQGSVLPGCCP